MTDAGAGAPARRGGARPGGRGARVEHGDAGDATLAELADALLGEGKEPQFTDALRRDLRWRAVHRHTSTPVR